MKVAGAPLKGVSREPSMTSEPYDMTSQSANTQTANQAIMTSQSASNEDGNHTIMTSQSPLADNTTSPPESPKYIQTLQQLGLAGDTMTSSSRGLAGCESEAEYVHELSKRLLVGWQAKLVPEGQGRIYYVNHQTQSSHWAPPAENWDANNGNGLPHAYEKAQDKNGDPYYLNHVTETTQKDHPLHNNFPSDPTADPEPEPPPSPREVELSRHTTMGFGFVAGSEKPVVVRFVTEGGPSEGKLLPGDQILSINEEDVEQSPREHVIDLVKSSKSSITMKVCQPQPANSGRKSALMTVAKRARLQKNPSRVRFADVIELNGDVHMSPSSSESYLPFMPNVLKVFLENGQTKSFKYDNTTSVKDVLESLQEKLGLQAMEHFGLVLQNMQRPTHQKMSLLQEDQLLAQIAARPGSQHLRCLFRLVFVPRDDFGLQKRDPAAFEYFYTQCTNDVVEGRFASELKFDVALRLGAWHIQQYCIAHNMSKVSLRAIEKEPGLDKFLPEALIESVRAKDIRKLLTLYMKQNQNTIPSGQKQPTALQTKTCYLKLLNEIRSFGGKIFLVTLEFLYVASKEKKAEVHVLVGPKQGLSILADLKSNTLNPLADFDELERATVERSDRETMRTVVLHLSQPHNKKMSLTMLSEDVPDFVWLLDGYYRIFVDKDASLLNEHSVIDKTASVPVYHGSHSVTPASWSYARPGGENEDAKHADFSIGPPSYHKPSTPSSPTQTKPVLFRQESDDLDEESEDHVTTSHVLSTQDSDTETSTQELTQQPADTTIPVKNTSTTNSITTTDTYTHDIIAHRKQTSPKPDKNANTHAHLNGDICDVTNSETEDDEDSSARIGEDPDGSRIEFLDSTLNSSFGDSMRDDNFVKSVLGAMAHAQARIDAEGAGGAGGAENKQEEAAGGSAGGVETDVTSQPVQMRARSTNVRERPGSFGLHSPDKVPQTDAELTQLTHQYRKALSPPAKPTSAAGIAAAQRGAEGKIESEGEDGEEEEYDHPSYNPKLFCDGGLYFDPDIIDLTLLPPPEDEPSGDPETPEIEPDMDFTGFSVPPPGFSDTGGATAAVTTPEVKKAGARRGLPMGFEAENESEAVGDFPLDMDLPPSIRDKIDSLVANDQELGAQIAAIDALLIEDARRDENEKESGIDSESETDELTEFPTTNTPTSSDDVTKRSRKKKSSPTQNYVNRMSKRASFQHINFATDNIDAFIASVTVPPPPPKDSDSPAPSPPAPPRGGGEITTRLGDNKITPRFDNKKGIDVKKKNISDNAQHDIGQLILDGHLGIDDVIDPEMGQDSWKDFLDHNPPTEALSELHIDDDIAQFVIPPPQSESNELDLASIPMVLPPSLSPTGSPRENDVVGAKSVNPTAREKSSPNSSTQNNTKSVSPKSTPTSPNAKPVPSIKPVLSSLPAAQSTTKPSQLPAKPKVDPQTKPKVDLTSKTIKRPVSMGEFKKNEPMKSSTPNPTPTDSEAPSDISKSNETESKTRIENMVQEKIEELSSFSGKSDGKSPGSISTNSTKTNSRSSLNLDPISPRVVEHARSSSDTLESPRDNKKIAPPAPPKRFSSLEPTSSESMTSPRRMANKNIEVNSRTETNTASLISPRRAPYKNIEINSRANISSPRERPQSVLVESQTGERVNDTRISGTLPRGGGTGKKKSAPPPPPRNSSMLNTAAEMHELTRSEDNLHVNAPKFSTFGQNTGRKYQRMFGNRPPHGAQSETNLITMFANKPNTPHSSQLNTHEKQSNNNKLKLRMPNMPETGGGEFSRMRSGSDSSDSQPGSPRSHAKFVAPSIQAKQVAIATAFLRQDSNENPSHSQNDKSPTSPRLPGSPRGTNRFFQKPASPLANHRNVQRRSGSPMGTLTKPDSPSLSPYDHQNGAISTVPGALVSPQTSPALFRHTSFSKAADHNPAPFKTFLGNDNGNSPTSPASPRTPVGYHSSPQFNRHTPLSPRHSATSSFESPRNSVQIVHSPRHSATESIHTPRNSAIDNIHSPRNSAMDNIRSPRNSAMDNVFTPRNSATDNVHSPRNSATDIIHLPRHSGAEYIQSPRNSSSEPLQSPRHSSSEAIHSPTQSPTEPIQSPRRIQPSRKAPPLPGGAAKHNVLEKATSLPSFSASSNIAQQPQLRRGNSIDTSTEFDLEDIIHEVLNRTYSGPNTFVQANMDVDGLIQLLNLRIANLHTSTGDEQAFTQHKDELVNVSRAFVGDSKALVSSATTSHDHVVSRVHVSMHTLGYMVQYCVNVMPHTRAAHDLGTRLTEVAQAYKSTVNAAAAAAGRKLIDPAMKQLMKQATGLASILSMLMKTLKVLTP